MRFLSNLIAATLGTFIALGLLVFIGIAILMAMASAFSTSSESVPMVVDNTVLVLNLDGPIPETETIDPLGFALGGSRRTHLRGIVSAIDRASVDERIDGLWIRVRGSTGLGVPLREIRKALLRFRESGKPVIASSNDYTISESTYYLVSAADSAFASRQAMFEFNGFFMKTLFYADMYERLDVKPQIIRTGKFKSAVEPYIRQDLSPENEAQLTALLDSHNRVFLDEVARERGTTADALHDLANRQAILAAPEALEAGLLDGLLYEDEVMQTIKERLGHDPDEDLRTIRIGSYAHTSVASPELRVNAKGDVAIVYAEGAIVSGSSLPGGILSGTVLGSESFARDMREVREDRRVKAVVVRINSPGGSASASDAMRRAIDLTAKEKPVVVSMGNVAASGGYWMATGSETIVADPLTITGSIGVFAFLLEYGGLLENKLGITSDGVQTSPFADMFTGLRPIEERERVLLQHFVDDIYEDFIDLVATNRGLDVEQAEAIAQGRVWSGRQALEIGLVDSLGSLNDAVNMAAQQAELGKGPYRLRILPSPPSIFEQFVDRFADYATTRVLPWTHSPAELDVLRYARTVKAHVRDAGTVLARMPMEIVVE